MERNLKTVSEFAKDSPISEAGMRWHIFNAATNGMAKHKVIVRIGRRVYVDVSRFDAWIESQNGGSGVAA